MKIIVSGTPRARSEHIAALLSSVAGISEEIECLGVPVDAESVFRRIDEEHGLAVLLLYVPPEGVVEAAIAEHGDVDDALSFWSSTAKRLLQIQQRVGARSVVLEGQRAANSPQAALALVSKRFELDLRVEEVALRPAARADGDDPDPLRAALAAQRIRESAEVWQLGHALKSAQCELPGADSDRASDWRAALVFYQRLLADKDSGDRRLDQVQEALERYYLEAKELRDDCGGAHSSQVQDLVRYALELERDYMKLLRSRTWKAMAPLREAGRLVKRIVRRRPVPRNRLPSRPDLLQKRS